MTPSRTPRNVLCLLVALSSLLAARVASAQSVDVLKTAHAIGKELDGWKFGDNEKEREINEQQFVLRIVEKLAGPVKDDVKKRILMSDLPADAARDAGGLVSKGDRRTRGVASALVDAGLAREVKLAEAQPGDFILYWIKSKSSSASDDKSGAKQGEKEKAGGTDSSKRASGGGDAAGAWASHCGVIEKIERNNKGEPKAFLFGSHKFTGGIGVAPLRGVRLVDDDDRRMYVVRWTKGAPEQPESKDDKHGSSPKPKK